MPTFTIESNLKSISYKALFAKKISVFLTKYEVPINHVIMKWNFNDGTSIYSGLYPFSGFSSEEDGKAFAFIDIQIGKDRTIDFRQGLITKIMETTTNYIKPDLLFINFDPVDPGNFFNSSFNKFNMEKKGNNYEY